MSLVFSAYDVAGEPLTGLSPTWHTHRNAWTGASSSGPAVTELGGGLYKSTSLAGDACGLLDLGATALVRYALAEPTQVRVFAVYNSGGTPLAGLSPAWDAYYDVTTGAAATGPLISEIGSGLYRINPPPYATRVAGVIDCGATASPRYLAFDDGADAAGGTTTFNAVRDNYTIVLEALTPVSLADVPFRRAPRHQPLRDQAGRDSATLRRFELVRGAATEASSYAAGSFERAEELVLTVAYPLLPALYGSGELDDMEKIIRQDVAQLRDTILSADNYTTGQRGTWIGEREIPSPERAEGVYFQAIPFTVRYSEAQSHL